MTDHQDKPGPGFAVVHRAAMLSPNWPKLRTSDLRTYLAIALHADKNNGKAWPSLDTIAECGVSRRAAADAIKRLVALDFISIVSRGGRGRRNVTTYQITHRKGAACCTKNRQEKVQHVAPKTGKKRCKNRNKRCKSGPEKVQHVAPERRNEGTKEAQAALPGIESPDEREAREAKRKAVAFTFHTPEGLWTMTAEQRDRLREKFWNVHVDSELAGLADWTARNPSAMKAAGMWNWLKSKLRKRQAERPLTGAALYDDGFTHESLPTDPTWEECGEFYRKIGLA